MMKDLTVISERVDDTPLLLAHQERMAVRPMLDTHFPTHGNWQGLSLGMVAEIWLSHILSEADHRLNHVQPWAEKRSTALSYCVGQQVRPLDFSDDRLADILRALSDDERWDAFEANLNGHLLRVYDLGAGPVRLDSTTASGYWTITPDGLFRRGHSKDKRPDLPQVKVMLSTLDPLGMPLATDVLPGNCADDPLYVPAIERVRRGVQRRGLLYVGDSKMGAQGTRAFVADGEDFYLCPLSLVQLPAEEREEHLGAVWRDEQSLRPVYRENPAGEREKIAEGFEWEEQQSVEMAAKTIIWTERRLAIRSFKLARAAQRGLRKRLTNAQTALAALNERGQGKRCFRQIEPLREKAEAILEKHRVQDLIRLTYEEIVQRRSVRGYGDRPARIEVERDYQVAATMDQETVQEAERRFGWRVYATNQPAKQLPLARAVLAYRDEYIVEHALGRLKGRPLSLTPMYLQRDDHATGLVRLLSIALRIMTLLEFVVRRCLAEEEQELAGLYAGNPKRSTARPTAELLLEAFDELTLSIVQEPHQTRYHLTPLSTVQQRILDLLDFPFSIYTSLAESCEPP